MKKYLKMQILLCILLFLLATGALRFLSAYHVIGFRLYPRNANTLDLCGQNVSLENYTRIQDIMPDCQIRWDVPLQSGIYPSDSTELFLPNLADTDLELLTFFPELKTLKLEDSCVPSLLLALAKAYPSLEIICNIPIAGQIYVPGTAALQLSTITPEDVTLLRFLPNLTVITVDSKCNSDSLKLLRDYCFAQDIELRITVGSCTLSSRDKSLTIKAAANDLMVPLSLMTQLETLHLPEPEADAANLLALLESLPNTTITWEKTVWGQTYSQDATQIDLTDIISLAEGQIPGDKTAYHKALEYPVLGTEEEVRSSAKVSKFHPLPDKTNSTGQLIEELEAIMAYFPKAEKLVLCGAFLDNDLMSDFRERHREDYKVVWSVQCGELVTRTDAKLFMPTKYHVYYFFTKDTYNLKYCEEIEAMDIGHMLVDDISFVEYMPNLKYLILTLTSIRDISPLATCKNLVFLEMDWNRVTDYSPLVGCTALEDLNIGETYGDIAPVLEMPWLKNLWLVGKSHESIRAAEEGLPNTHIGAYYNNPDDGWRQLPNYFAMRDALLMFYML